MKTREWEHVVRALLHLGAQRFGEDDQHVRLIRGAMRWVAIRKMPVSIERQRQVLVALEFSELEWAQALRMTADAP